MSQSVGQRARFDLFPGDNHYRNDYPYHERQNDQIPEIERNRILKARPKENSSDDEYYSTVKEAARPGSCAEELNSFRTPPLCDLEDTAKHRTDRKQHDQRAKSECGSGREPKIRSGHRGNSNQIDESREQPRVDTEPSDEPVDHTPVCRDSS